MYSWGSATNNALGHGDEEDKEEPEEVTSKQLETRDVVAVSVGGQHSTILAVANNNNGSWFSANTDGGTVKCRLLIPWGGSEWWGVIIATKATEIFYW